MPRISLFAAAIIFCTSSMALSQVTSFNCNLTDLKKGGGWIPRVAVFEVDTASKGVRLIRPAQKDINGNLKGGKLVRNTADKMIVRWEVTRARSGSNQVVGTFRYRAVIDKKTGQVSVIAKPVGFGNDFRGKGTCKIG